MGTRLANQTRNFCFRFTGSNLFWGLVVCFLLYTAPGHAQISLKGLPFVRTFSTEEYRGGIQNWDIAQGASDLIYVANNFGVLVYDGEQWTTLPIEKATRILSVAYGANARIYLGGQGDFGYLQVGENGMLNYVSLKEELPAKYQNFNEIWKIYSRGETTWFFTFNHIFRLVRDQLEVIDPEMTLGFSFDVRNQLFTHVPSQGLMLLKDRMLVPVEGGDEMAGKDLRGMVPYGMDQTLLATRGNGLFLMDGDRVTPWEVPCNEWLKKAQINAILLLSSNKYAIATQNSGILIIDRPGNVEQLLAEDRGLTDNSVLSIFEDRFGNLWAGLNNGIALVELGQAFSLVNDDLELSGTGYTAIKNGSQIYLGTNNGLYTLENKLSDSLFYPGYRKIAGTEGQTYSLQKAGDDLVLGHHNGAFQITRQQAGKIENTVQGVWKIEELPFGKGLFIAGSYNGMHLLQNREGAWRFTKKYSGFEESSRKFELAGCATVWMSHGYKGIYKLSFSKGFEDLENVRFYGKEDGFPSNLLINVFKVQNRLVFTAERGTYSYDAASDRFVPDSVLTPYFGEQHIRELEEDIMGNLYFLADDEVGVLKKNPLGGYRKETAAFQKILPFVSDDLENITVFDQENILFNAREGFIHYNPALNPKDTKVFTTVFRQVSWGDSTLFGGYDTRVPLSGEKPQEVTPKLPYSKNAVHFKYASVFFEGAYQARYQYWLENFDNDWSEWSTLTEKEYTNLPAGDYTFHVRSRNSLGQQSKASVYRFKVLPPWYKSSAAYTVYALACIAAGAAGARLLNKKYKQQQYLVENANKTIQEKETRLIEITTRTEQEINQLKSERLESELQHKNRELASSAMHLINKNEIMDHLKSEINQLLKEEDRQTVNKGLRRIGKIIEKNIAEDETWNQFEMHFDQVHGDFIKKLRSNYPGLTQQELKLSAFLRMNMSSKEIARLLNISVRGVEVSRYRLRKKLPIESHENLVEFMMSVG